MSSDQQHSLENTQGKHILLWKVSVYVLLGPQPQTNLVLLYYCIGHKTRSYCNRVCHCQSVAVSPLIGNKESSVRFAVFSTYQVFLSNVLDHIEPWFPEGEGARVGSRCVVLEDKGFSINSLRIIPGEMFEM